MHLQALGHPVANDTQYGGTYPGPERFLHGSDEVTAQRAGAHPSSGPNPEGLTCAGDVHAAKDVRGRTLVPYPGPDAAVAPCGLTNGHAPLAAAAAASGSTVERTAKVTEHSTDVPSASACMRCDAGFAVEGLCDAQGPAAMAEPRGSNPVDALAAVLAQASWAGEAAGGSAPASTAHSVAGRPVCAAAGRGSANMSPPAAAGALGPAACSVAGDASAPAGAAGRGSAGGGVASAEAGAPAGLAVRGGTGAGSLVIKSPAESYSHASACDPHLGGRSAEQCMCREPAEGAAGCAASGRPAESEPVRRTSCEAQPGLSGSPDLAAAGPAAGTGVDLKLAEHLCDPLCTHCPNVALQSYAVPPRPLWLHARRYACADWAFECPLPAWAAQDFVPDLA